MRARVYQSASPGEGTKAIRSIHPLPSLLRQKLVLLVILASAVATCAQTDSKPQKPYAAIDREAINYAGPDREAAHDLPGPEIRIGLLAPLQGPRTAEGEALRQAAQLAIEDEAAEPLPGGRRLLLVWRDESGPWGRASSEIVRLVFDDQAIALITSADGVPAHLAEQVGNKVGVPVLTLASDATTTEINIPWLFRLAPSDVAQAEAFAQHIYRERGYKKVLLVTEPDHDGRVGGDEFVKAVRRLNAPAPTRLTLARPPGDIDARLDEISQQNPEAVVLWTGAEAAAKLVKGLRSAESRAALYLCQKATQEPFRQSLGGSCRSCSAAPAKEGSELWVAVAPPRAATARRQSFEQRYQARLGIPPSFAAAAAYDAVCLIAAALRQAGPNRARLRDSLATLSDFPGVSGTISFDGAGNNQARVTLVPRW